ncbi:SPOR domain-containing protein [Flavobacterium sp. H122]|uniref:SPOR domain-containing protein n=1 Tax=Flavobacterium sp. H122 TaxID=2529860 RepID=UPI0010AA1C19|nr:SPOR domain-containing protein [Flavobacterium sp. H122]
MRILTITKTLLNISTTVFFLTFSFAQEGKSKINQDPRFEQLLSEKRKINSSITVNERYKIQIFTGDAATSKKTLTEFRKSYKNIDATIVFHTPIYKVWVGSFKTRIEAEKKLQDLKKKYPNAFLIKPNK